MRVASATFVLGFASVLGACGGAAAPGVKSSETPSDDLDTLASEIESAERELAAELGARTADTPKPTEPAAGGEGMVEEKKAEPTATPSPEAARPSSPCETACKALGSMKRSQQRICEIAGAAHERCEWAKQRVTEATSRVEKAGCSCD